MCNRQTALKRSNPIGAAQLAALEDIAKPVPFQILGVGCDNRAKFINGHLLAWCAERKITLTRSRPGSKNASRNVEQKNWAIVRIVVSSRRCESGRAASSQCRP